MRFELFVALRYLKAKRDGKLPRVWVRQETTGERGDGRLNGGKRLCSFDGEVVGGYIRSRTARALIRRWAVGHRRELEANWEKMKAGRPLDRIEPLE